VPEDTLSLIRESGIAVYREGEWAERGEITLGKAAEVMDVSVMTALRMVLRDIINGRQLCKGAPWVIKAEDMAAYVAQRATQRLLTSRRNRLSQAMVRSLNVEIVRRCNTGKFVVPERWINVA
jgi:hypothetical protein